MALLVDIVFSEIIGILSFAKITSDENLATELPEEDESTATDGSRILNLGAKYELNFPIQG